MEGILLVVGLGNPGSQYASTRHNVGQWFVASYLERDCVHFQLDTRLEAQLARFKGRYYALPTCFMNHSGRCVQKLMHYFKIDPKSILVIHDELDLSPRIARLKVGGGHGGHNGLRDIIENIGPDFMRLRIGIGHPGGQHEDVSNFVLKPPSVADKQAIEESIIASMAIMPLLYEGKVSIAMNQLHTELK